MNSVRLFAFLIGAGARNRVARQIARLKNPRYAVALVVGLAYFGYIFFGMGNGNGDDEAPRAGRAALEGIAPFVIAMFATWWWLRGGYESALAFSPAEVHFLFPAPLTRRSLIQFKLLRSQLAVVMSAVLLTVIVREGALPWYLRIVSFWAMLSALHFHQIVASLIRSNAAQQGSSGFYRTAIPIVIVGLAFIGLVWSVTAGLPDIRSAEGVADALRRLTSVLDRPVPRIALLPFQLVVAPVFAADLSSWLRAMPGAIVVLALHYVWVIRTEAAFEEGAARAGVKRAERIAAIRAGKAFSLAQSRTRRGQLLRFKLRPTGPPARAIVWKNMLAFVGQLRPLTLVILLVGIGAVFAVVVLSAGSWRSGVDAMALMGVIVAGMVTMFGPLGFRHDLRRDLEKVELLRTYPLSSHSLVAAELAATTITLTVVQFGCLAVTLLLLPFTSIPATQLPGILAIGAMAVVVLPAINALGIAIQNALALMFPGWLKIGADAPGGIEHMGQNILTILGTVFLLVVAMIGPLLIGAVVGGAMAPVLGVWAGVPMASFTWLALCGEVALLVWWLGGVYERLDPVEAGLLR
ncbi:MAG: hypothetical protein GTN62_03240 [Gemmatimonadales bacterium]|nr:hypothetical protein [Gemmatimonadales bacterium]NIN49115.1 hypothetical protein [Gemmatimonadales bacterium]NIP06579.1 hypothetical protein [Gemmatimonadales bacterium]NIR00276.1 hypothetical protein [Gemmatimonadales bacterium]NIS64609.1 hypothetical protein [Gemmatimonadales bacterium]